MSSWDRFGGFPRGPKKPPPAHGIKMKKAGTTWWGQRWIAALEAVLGADSGRLARGRTYARAGRTHDLIVKDGQVSAKVTGSQSKPYSITIEVARLTDAAWAKAIAGMAAKAQFSAELLAGQMPQAIEDVFREAGVSLFPTRRADLVTDCSCPDWGDPCKHVAATHYVLGEAFDRDPFLLFELRGKTRTQVIDALRAARGGASAPEAKARSRQAVPAENDGHANAVPSMRLGKLDASDYDKPRGELPALQLSFEPPATHGAVLRQLGAPGSWQGDDSPADLLAPLVQAAAEAARRIAMDDAARSGAEAAPETSTPRPPERPPASSSAAAKAARRKRAGSRTGRRKG